MLKRYWDTTAGTLALAAIFAFVLAVMAVPVKAETASAPPLFDLPQASAKAPWSGFYAGAGINRTIAEVSGSGPVGLSSDAWAAVPIVGFDYQFGQMLAGMSVSYAFLQGDLKDLGINRELAVTARAGFLPTSDVLLYGHVSWARLNTDFGDVDGWKIGPGVEVKTGSPITLDFRYEYGTWDVSGLPSSIDVHSHTFMVAAKYRFGTK